ncbi:MAG: hypothetical protein KY455_09095 [Euryarchaeota archaeon]|nr:hypothetical protein [Euryarchaeota archaeon]
MTDPGPLWTLRAPLARTGLVLRLFDRVDRMEGTHDGLRLDIDGKQLALPYEEIYQVQTNTVRRNAGILWGSVFFATAIMFLTFSVMTLTSHPVIALLAATGAILQAFYSWIALVGVDEFHITIETLDGQKHRFVAEPEEAERYLVGLME